MALPLRKAARQYAAERAARHPAVRGLWIGGIAALVSFIFVRPFIFPIVAGTLLLAASGIVYLGQRLFAGPRHIREYLDRHREVQMNTNQEVRHAELLGRLAKLRIVRGVEQLSRLNTDLDLLNQLVDEQLAPGEIAHAECLSAAQRLESAIIHNLEQVVVLQGIVNRGNRDDLVSEIDTILNEGDEALAALSRAISAIASIRTTKTRRKQNLGETVSDLLRISRILEQHNRMAM